MKKCEGWLSAVEHILRASTGDLRELARLGGADPETLFIGTDMSGVDVRGQDLRGMCFTKLDARTILSDATTLFDPGQMQNAGVVVGVGKLQVYDDVGPIVYFAGPNGPNPDQFDLFRKLHGWRVYPAGDISAFIDACQNARGRPKFIVFNLPDFSAAREAVQLINDDVVLLSTVALRTEKQLHKWATVCGQTRSLVSVPTLAMGGTPSGVVQAETIDALLFMADHWSHVVHLLKDERPVVFMRARGLGPNHERDAWCQIYSKLMRVGLSAERGFAARKLRSTSETFRPSLLFPGTTPVGYSPQNFDACILAQVGIAAADPYNYRSLTLRLLSEWGWAVDFSLREDDFSTLDLVPRDKGPVSVKFASLGEALHTNNRISVVRDLHDFEFADVQTIVVSEESKVDLIVDRLLYRRQLWVSLRDLDGFRPESGSLWLLLASQARRMTGPFESVARSRYFELLLRAAAKSGAKSDFANKILEVLNSPYRYGRADISPISVRFSGLEATCIMRISMAGTGSSYSVTPYLKVILQIGRNGVDIASVVDVSTEKGSQLTPPPNGVLF